MYTNLVSNTPVTEIKNISENNFNLSPNQISELKKISLILSKNSNDILQRAKAQNKLSIICQIVMIILGIATSYISAVSGMPDIVKTYTVSVLSMINACVSSIYSLMKFSKTATLMYTAHKEIREKLNKINTSIVNMSSNESFESLMYTSDKIMSKYDIFTPITIDETIPEDYKDMRIKILEQEIEKQQKILNNINIFQVNQTNHSLNTDNIDLELVPIPGTIRTNSTL